MREEDYALKRASVTQTGFSWNDIGWVGGDCGCWKIKVSNALIIISIKQFLLMMNNQFPLGPSVQPTSLRLEYFVCYYLVFYFKLSDLKNIFNTTMIQSIMMKGTHYHEFKILMFEWTICWLYLTHIDHSYLLAVSLCVYLCMYSLRYAFWDPDSCHIYRLHLGHTHPPHIKIFSTF